MTHHEVAKELDKNRSVFSDLLGSTDRERYLFRPEPAKWCVLEVVCHLCDEEREDFRARLKHVLETPTEPMPSIDPQGWVASRAYLEQDYEKKVQEFLEERDRSVQYLHTLDGAAWGNIYDHPKFGPLPATLFLHNWLAHDLLHIRQINAIRYFYLKSQSPDTLEYAGNW